jgi:2-polyprenyl-6-methoxyphenol hydroxylase-like FAD-dependent oxidoreductase
MTKQQHFHVGIVGGGIGGLCLAQGLRKAGISVAVYERDRACTERLQGYRIHIGPKGSRALHACLPAHLFDAFVATCGMSGGGFRLLTEQMHELLTLDLRGDENPIDRHHSASRITLRQVLLAGLDEVVHFDKAFVRYATTRDGRIAVHFADGSSAPCDVLVGADGGNSCVRLQYLPEARRIDTGVVGIVGKALLTEESRSRLPASVLRGTGLVMAPGRCSMFMALQEFWKRPAAPAAAIGGNDAAAMLEPGALFDNTTSYVMWAYGGYRADIPGGAQLDAMPGNALRAIVLDLIRSWHPDLHSLVAASDPGTISVVRIRTAVPVAAWETTQVTLIGDAIHSMTPYRGIGANIALRDAALLCRNLVSAAAGAQPLRQAIHDYERQMRKYAFAAVRTSLKALERAVADKGLGFRLAKLLFRAVDAVPPLKRLAFARLGSD